jgi:3-keto-disaccharide hydrolase
MNNLSFSFNGLPARVVDNAAGGECTKMNVTGAKIVIAAFAMMVLFACCGCGQASEFSSNEPPQVGGGLRRFAFTAADVDSLPQGWEIAQTGAGDGSRWSVVADGTAPSKSGYVIAQTAESPRSMFNLCVVEKGRYADLTLRVAFKAVEGEVDQGGGLVWRYVDTNNYYVCRVNPLEDNLRIYKVIAGSRQQLASVDVELAADQWHNLTATMQGNQIVCGVDGTNLSVRDNTLTDAGRIGLWTKADARTHFDTLSVTGNETTPAGEPQDGAS